MFNEFSCWLNESCVPRFPKKDQSGLSTKRRVQLGGEGGRESLTTFLFVTG